MSHHRFLLLLLGIPVLIAALFGQLGIAAAAFSDRVEANGGLAAGTLPTPATLAGTPRDAAVTLTWSAAPGDFATTYEVFRREGSCSGWSPSGAPLATVSAAPPAYTDSDTRPGATYCYAVRGAFEQWRSPFSMLAEVTLPSAVITPAKLYLQGPATLQTVPEGGGDVFEHGAVRIYRSAGPVTIGSGNAWTASLALLERGNPGAGIAVAVEVWHVATSEACGSAPPSSAQRMASGTASRTPQSSDLVFDVPELVTMQLSGSYEAPEGPRSICTSVAVSIESGNPASRWYLIGYGAQSWLQGPVVP